MWTKKRTKYMMSIYIMSEIGNRDFKTHERTSFGCPLQESNKYHTYILDGVASMNRNEFRDLAPVEGLRSCFGIIL